MNARVTEVRSSSAGVTWVAADRYQDVSKLAYTARGQPEVFCICLGGRQNQDCKVTYHRCSGVAPNSRAAIF